MRARLWRSITEEGAVEVTKERHRDIYTALRARDAELASAADLIHLGDGERWLRRVIEMHNRSLRICRSATEERMTI